MKVGELIAALGAFDPDDNVCIKGPDGAYDAYAVELQTHEIGRPAFKVATVDGVRKMVPNDEAALKIRYVAIIG